MEFANRLNQEAGKAFELDSTFSLLTFLEPQCFRTRFNRVHPEQFHGEKATLVGQTHPRWVVGPSKASCLWVMRLVLTKTYTYTYLDPE